MKKDKIMRSCIDCASKGCDMKGGKFPDFCLTKNLDPELLDKAMSLYTDDEENHNVTIASAEVEYENYCKMTRIEEIMEFAKKSAPESWGSPHVLVCWQRPARRQRYSDATASKSSALHVR